MFDIMCFCYFLSQVCSIGFVITRIVVKIRNVSLSNLSLKQWNNDNDVMWNMNMNQGLHMKWSGQKKQEAVFLQTPKWREGCSTLYSSVSFSLPVFFWLYKTLKAYNYRISSLPSNLLTLVWSVNTAQSMFIIKLSIRLHCDTWKSRHTLASGALTGGIIQCVFERVTYFRLKQILQLLHIDWYCWVFNFVQKIKNCLQCNLPWNKLKSSFIQLSQLWTGLDINDVFKEGIKSNHVARPEWPGDPLKEFGWINVCGGWWWRYPDYHSDHGRDSPVHVFSLVKLQHWIFQR